MSHRRPIRGKDSFLSLRSTRSKQFFVVSFTVLHMLLTGLFFFWSFSVVMAHADDSNPLPASAELLVRISDIFQWPLIITISSIASLRTVLPAYSVYIALLLNSLLWALVALGIILWLRKLRR
ncbi:MAG: hypothetical protein A2Y53_06510 [Chloroflexi bacterium RBG_16_47_49]|nr:MAG: hypothetical protein A2Y53_06510 [Chloroflexi bacterium RBG_16_47_49]